MRPLPVRPLRGAPFHVLGLALVRGEPSVVVDVSLLLGGTAVVAQRFVSLRTEGPPVVLAVEAVLGIRQIDLACMQAMPRGLGTHKTFQGLGTLDQNLVLSLDVHQLLRDAGLALAQGA